MASLLPRFYINASRFVSSATQPFPYIKVRPPSIFDYCVDLIPLCTSTNYLIQVHSRLVALGLFPFWAPKLLKRSSELGDLSYSILLFKWMDSPGTFCVNNILKAYSIGTSPEKCVILYFELLRDRPFIPNSYTFLHLIGSCANAACLISGMKCHGQILRHGLACLPVQNSLVSFYGTCGDVELARKVFEEVAVRDVVSWNSILSAYVIVGNLKFAHDLFDIMPEKNVISWNILLCGYLKGGNPGYTMMVFRKMVSTGTVGNERTMVAVMIACGRSNRIREGRSVHGYVVRTLKVLNLIVSTSLIDMYSKCRKVETAQKIFKLMNWKNLVSWNAMLLGHCIHGNPMDGLNLFAHMLDLRTSRMRDSFSPDEVTFVGVLCACARLVKVTEGERFFRQMIDEFGIKPNFAHYWCLSNIYMAAGLQQTAKNILKSYSDANVSSESSTLVDLLIQYRFHGGAAAAERMASYFAEIDSLHFCHYHFLANVYAAAGKWDEVMKVKEMAKRLATRRVPTVDLQDLNHIVQKYSAGTI